MYSCEQQHATWPPWTKQCDHLRRVQGTEIQTRLTVYIMCVCVSHLLNYNFVLICRLMCMCSVYHSCQLYFTIVKTSDEQHTLCSFLHTSITFSVLCQNILPCTLFPDIFSPQWSFRVWDQVSHPCRTGDKNTVLYFMFMVPCIIIYSMK